MDVECILGEIRLFAGSYCPRDWAYCNGQLLPVSDNEALFSLLGNTYGGDGYTSFAVPDYRGRIIIGQGTGPGLTPRRLGQKFGVETVALDVAQIPNHNHPFNATTAIATSTNPEDCILANPGPGAVMYEAESTADNLKPLASKAVASTGSGIGHDNLMPCSVISYIIALKGTYPTRS